MASEPVAFHLYKSRHFRQFEIADKNKDNQLEEDVDDKKDQRFQLLDTANARILGAKKFTNMIKKYEENSSRLDNKIVNLPHHLKNNMEKRLIKVI